MFVQYLVLFVAILIIAAIYAYYKVIKQHENYWKKRNVPYYGGTLLPIVKTMIKKVNIFDYDKDLYKIIKQKNCDFMGYTEVIQNALMVRDVEGIKQIMIKDSDYFVDRRIASTRDSNTDLHLSKMLISLTGEEWKDARSKLSPTFTTGKIKRMFRIFEKTSLKMISYVKKEIDGRKGELEFCSLAGKFTLDTIAEAAFGMDSRAFESNATKQFEKMTKDLMINFGFIAMMKFIVILLMPKLAVALNISIANRKAEEFFSQLLSHSIKTREKNASKMDDFLQILIEAKEGKSKMDMKELDQFEKDALINGNNDKGERTNSFDDDFIISQIMLFLMAGFDTTQSLLIMATYVLAIHPDAQEKLFNEVMQTYEESGEFGYDKVNSMPYLDQVIQETLRLYPPAVRTERVCTKTYQLSSKSIKIEKGTLIAFPVFEIHRDPDYYEDPDTFKPERFSPEEKQKRSPYTFLPFGHGPRNCIGMRFALTEAKLALCHLIKNFKLEPCGRTEIPVQFGVNNSLRPKNGSWLTVQLR